MGFRTCPTCAAMAGDIKRVVPCPIWKSNINRSLSHSSADAEENLITLCSACQARVHASKISRIAKSPSIATISLQS